MVDCDFRECPSCLREFPDEATLEAHWLERHWDQEGELCPEVFGCPNCGERRMDWLAWLEPYCEELECLTCGRVYEP